MKLLWILIGLSLLWPHTSSAEVMLCGRPVVFASVEQGRRILEAQDEYIERMSPLDRAVRMKTDREATEREFLAFAGASVREWRTPEREIVEAALIGILPGLKGLDLPDLGTIYLIKTSGEEEGNAAYTRGNAVALPQSTIQETGNELERLLAHELFHILSRNQPAVRNALYEAIGFHYCGDPGLPQAPGFRKMTNPDAPRNDYCIRVKIQGREVWVRPILFSRFERYDNRDGRGLFDYLSFGFLVAKDGEHSDNARSNGSPDPLIMSVDQISGFFDQVGRNTQYIVHPEEILADNFALLALGEKDVPSPEILQKVRDVLLRSDNRHCREG